MVTQVYSMAFYQPLENRKNHDTHACFLPLQETHVRTVHNHEKPFNCSICDYLCANKGRDAYDLN